jgi:hypothetical protein
MNTPSPLEPIAPLGSESPGAYEAFLCYFELGPNRTLKKTAEILEISQNSVNDWSSRYNWRQRIREYRAKLMTERLQAKANAAEAGNLSTAQSAPNPALNSLVNELGNRLLQTSHNLFHHQLVNNAEKIDMGQVLRMMQLGEKLLNSARTASAPALKAEPPSAPAAISTQTPAL